MNVHGTRQENQIAAPRGRNTRLLGWLARYGAPGLMVLAAVIGPVGACWPNQQSHDIQACKTIEIHGDAIILVGDDNHLRQD